MEVAHTGVPGAVVPRGSADRGAGGVVELNKGWEGMTAASQGLWMDGK